MPIPFRNTSAFCNLSSRATSALARSSRAGAPFPRLATSGNRQLAHHRLANYSAQVRNSSTTTKVGNDARSRLWPAVLYGSAFTAGVATVSFMSSSSNTSYAEAGVQDGVAPNSLTSDPRIGVKNKSTYDLVVSLLVYKMCMMTTLVEWSPKLIELCEKLHITGPAYWFIKHTFFNHFCGGENQDEIASTMDSFKSAGIGSILDVSIEVDLDKLPEAETPEAVRALWNDRADQVASLLKGSVKAASVEPNSFSAIKLTPLLSPLTLQKVSYNLYNLRASFVHEDGDKDGRLNKEEFASVIKQLPGAKQSDLGSVIDALFERADVHQQGSIDWIDFSRSLSLEDPLSRPLFMGESNKEPSSEGAAAFVPLSRTEMEDFDLFMGRVVSICEYAQENKVRLMIDAEQSYFQDAIDYAAMEVSQRYNQVGQESGPLVFNTYQMYLKDSTRKLMNDYERSQRQNFTFGAKLVRGAYMVTERKRCEKLGIPDIINNTIEDTHQCYDSGVAFLLDQIKPTDTLSSTPAAFMVASHNKDSVAKTCAGLEKRGLSPKTDMVMFGQLMGMKDGLSYALGANGYKIFKYVPYGPIHEVVPYLIRRAQENSSVLGAAQEEYDVIFAEIKFRLFGQGTKIPVEVKTA
ncbi:FAD-linked oxidoreductase [Basidiobolus meristosporus CBS 931.73]|uniref:Proline dehydrogenase n=1 Tax=Basidiobolus meristosporus CBS 931.73 TaxID=1314790 RepID=A0A1Y1YFD6_9FUNG|nr:FAD-linked oxidoreductase [Basidiobolus meristosporus CBS 931.73]|eukprot:ORX96722.1 FAD-linked oxidoreductase [Basidiobolus meristosporus CBS 931.73]